MSQQWRQHILSWEWISIEPQEVTIVDSCKVRAEGTVGNEPNRGKAGHQYLRSTAGHVGSCWDRWRQKGLTSAWMLHPHRLPVPHFRKTGLRNTLIPELLDIMAEVFYLIHGLYIVVTNNNK